jgi:S1-C subfamily serine protease
MRFHSGVVALVLVALAPLACAPSVRAPLPTLAEQDASFRPFAATRVGDVDLERFLRQRTGPLFCGADVRPVTATAGEVVVQLDFDYGGSAVVLSADGYLLTAAHCIHERPGIGIVAAEGFRVLPARVVWKGAYPAVEDLDLALIHVDATLRHAFAWAGEPEIAPDTPLVAAGYLYAKGEGDLHLTVAGGKALAAPRDSVIAGDEPRVAVIEHSVPVTRGDSGGALATLEGRLVGINVCVATSPDGARTNIALRPDPAWIAARIEQDRREHPTGR